MTVLYGCMQYEKDAVKQRLLDFSDKKLNKASLITLFFFFFPATSADDVM